MTATRITPSPVQAPASRLAGNRWAALTVLMFGTFMFVLDFFIVNVALPSIQQSLQAGENAVEWVVAGYGVSTAVLLVTGGRLGDQFGRRRVFALGMALFVVTSAACALAPDPAVLVAARVVQGVGVGLMAPNILSILGVVYTGPARVRAISIYGMVMGLAATSGQLIGGVLIGSDLGGLGWRAIFWINVPLGVAALLACPRLVPESGADQGSRLDLTGVTLITACLVAVVLPLVQGRQAGWPAVGAVLAATGDGVLYLATAHGGAVAWLFPGLLLLGAGQGLCITPLTTTVLSHAGPASAGSVSGALSTAQQVGNSIGVAVTGVLFFGALGHGYGLAFERSVLQMGPCCSRWPR